LGPAGSGLTSPLFGEPAGGGGNAFLGDNPRFAGRFTPEAGTKQFVSGVRRIKKKKVGAHSPEYGEKHCPRAKSNQGNAKCPKNEECTLVKGHKFRQGCFQTGQRN
jgi:hypothetical protein